MLPLAARRSAVTPVLAAVALLAGPGAQEGAPELPVGASVEGRLAAGEGRAFALTPARDGRLTLSLASWDFDARLRVEDAAGALVVADDDGGVETNARLVLDARAGATYRVLVGAAGEGAGEFTLRVAARAGAAPADRPEAGVAFREQASARALERGDLPAAARHLEACADGYTALARYAEARATWLRLQDVAAELGDARIAARARLGRAVSASQLGELEAARELARAAREGFRAAGDAAGEAEAWGALGITAARATRWDEALGHLERQLELARAAGARRLEGRALMQLGAVENLRGGLEDAAREHLAAATERAREVGDEDTVVAAGVNLAWLLAQTGEHAAARAEAERLLPVLRRRGDREKESAVGFTLGYALARLGEPERAREVLGAVLEQSRSVGNLVRELYTLSELATVCQRLGDLPAARRWAEQRYETARTGGFPWHEGWALRQMAQAERGTGRLDAAEAHLQMALPLAVVDEDLRRRIQLDLGGIDLIRGELDAADGHFREALERARATGDLRMEANALGGLGAVAVTRGDAVRARRLLEDALGGLRSLDDGGGTAWCLTNLSVAERLEGRLLEARALAEEAVRVARESGARVYLPEALSGLADAHHDLADFGTAIELIDEALAVARAQGHRHQQLAALRQRADVHRHLGEPERSLRAMEEALPIARETGSELQLARVLLEHASVLLDLDAEEALVQYERARAMLEEIGAVGLAASALGNLAAGHLRVGRLPRARELFEERLELARAGADRPGEVFALRSLAEVEFRQGQPDRALARADQALELASEAGIELRLVGLLYWRARAALSQGDAGAVAADLARVEALVDRIGGPGLEIGQASGFRARWSAWGRMAQDLAALREAAASGPLEVAAARRDGFRAAGRWKGRALLEGIVEHRQGGRSAEAIALRRERREVLALRDDRLERVAAAAAAAAPLDEVEALRAEAAELAARAETLARELERVSPRDAALDRPAGVLPEAARRALIDERTALVDYACGFERLYAWVLTAGGLERLDLGDVADLESRVDRFVAGMADPEALASPARIAAEGRALARDLLDPVIAVAGEGVERLAIVPTGALTKLPFEALVLSAPAAIEGFASLVHVIDRYEVVYGPSTPVLVELARLGPRERAGRILILADPTYPAEATATGADAEPPSRPSILAARAPAGPQPRELRRLVKTRAEALALARSLVALDADPEGARTALARLTERRSGTVTTELFDLALGTAASPARLAGDLRGYSVLHLAAHGYVDQADPRRSGLALAFEEDAEGWFTVADALELDLDANLAVLSACDTARGELRPGEGVQSLARAFLYAGSRAVVASAWQVADWAAAETMEAFYAAVLREDLPPARALREAKLALRRRAGLRGVGVGAVGGPTPTDAAHPFFWAPLLLVGAR